MLRNDHGTTWVYRTAECPGCAELTVQIGRTDAHGELIGNWLQIDPMRALVPTFAET
jgi:hypothetical protein